MSTYHRIHNRGPPPAEVISGALAYRLQFIVTKRKFPVPQSALAESRVVNETYLYALYDVKKICSAAARLL
jgi:hypothetical protein